MYQLSETFLITRWGHKTGFGNWANMDVLTPPKKFFKSNYEDSFWQNLISELSTGYRRSNFRIFIKLLPVFNGPLSLKNFVNSPNLARCDVSPIRRIYLHREKEEAKASALVPSFCHDTLLASVLHFYPDKSYMRTNQSQRSLYLDYSSAPFQNS